MAPAKKRPASASGPASAGAQKGKKRTSSESGCVPKGVPRKVQKLYHRVVGHIKASDVEPKVKSMVADFIKPGLGKPAVFRHPFMRRSLGMVEELLDSNRKKVCSEAADFERKIKQGDAEEVSRKSCEEAARWSVEETKKTAFEAGVAVVHAQEAIKYERSALAATENGIEEAMRDAKKAVGTTARLKNVMSGPYASLKETTIIKFVKTVSKMAKDLGVDYNLVNAGANSLARSPHSRTTFDAVVLRHFDESLRSSLQYLEVSAANAGMELEKLSVRRTGEEERVATAVVNFNSAKSNKKSARKAYRGALKAFKTVRKSVKNLGLELKKASSSLSAAQKKIKAIEESIMFVQELRERSNHDSDAEADDSQN